jgi:hypothetical protein
MRFLLFVGAGNTLAAAEIGTKIQGSTEILPNIYSFELDDSETAIKTVSLLGSSIKLAEEVPGLAAQMNSIADFIKAKNFSVTSLGDSKSASVLNQEIKNILGKGRFVLSKDPFGLSPILLKKHKIDEFFIDQDKDEVWKTIWVHDFRHWIQKDRHMPFANAKAGILPPKIARSMVNLVPLEPEGKLLVDPFCGSGRILVEAAEMGFTIAGTDILESQCRETKANLTSLGFDPVITVLDATHLSEKYRNIDAIVTEPFLGKPNPRPDQMRYIVPGLQKLYLGCLKDWLGALKSGGFVVMVFPWFNDGKKVYKTSSVIDGKLELSYNLLKRDILYSRPEADVKREIVILQKK